MMRQTTSPEHSSAGKGGKCFPALCSILGTLILLGVIAAFMPLSVPRLLGYGVYQVVSESMEPEIPVGSAVYVKAAKPEEIQEQDIIAFVKGEMVITHRVEENRCVEGEFITKGDANSQEDPVPVDYESLIGKVMYHIPYLGILMALISGTAGKVYAAALAVCGVMFHMLSASVKRSGEA